MHCRITPIYRRGVRRSREDVLADPGVVGELSIFDHPGTGLRFGRPVRQAELRTRHGPDYYIALPPLFDVEILRMTQCGFVLRGVEVSTVNGESAEVIQEWWARPDQTEGSAAGG